MTISNELREGGTSDLPGYSLHLIKDNFTILSDSP
jgi:hypothetical protein